LIVIPSITEQNCGLYFQIAMYWIEDRIALTTTMLLTLMALRFVAASEVPKFTYLTLLDLKFGGSLTVCMLCIIFQTVAYKEEYVEDDSWKDELLLYILMVLDFLFHVYFVWRALSTDKSWSEEDLEHINKSARTSLRL